MPLRNYPISGPITLQNQNDSYLAMTYDPSKPQVATNQKSYQRFVTHTAVGEQTVPNDILDDDDDYGDLIDMYAITYASNPAPRVYTGNGVNQRSPSSGSATRGRTPAFLLKHSNASTPAIVHRPKKKASINAFDSHPSPRSNRLNSPSSTSVNDKSQEARKRLHSRFSKPLPPPPTQENNIPHVPKIPDAYLPANRVPLKESPKNRAQAHIRPGPVAHQWGGQQRGRVQASNVAHIHAPNDGRGVSGEVAAIVKEVDEFLVRDMRLDPGARTRDHRRRYE